MDENELRYKSLKMARSEYQATDGTFYHMAEDERLHMLNKAELYYRFLSQNKFKQYLENYLNHNKNGAYFKRPSRLIAKR